jgi:SAM-dependent methyltransferase
MSDWTSGYVAEIDYTHGFYRELTPGILGFAALARGQARPSLGGPLAYCELGCGQGFSANLLAAANPAISIHATDFNPTQIAGAQALARQAGTPNVHFSDAAFDQYLADDSLPAFDIIALHGIYSWVSAENRSVIVDFIRKKLKVGGLVYISYNTLPGWAAAMPMRRLFVEHAGSTGGPLAARIEKALVFTDRLKTADVAYFRMNPGIKARFEGLQGMNRNYLAHEYFNRDWEPMYFSDVARDLAHAKLDHVGSVNILDHIDALNLSPEHQPLLREVGDPVLQETVRDYLTMQQFRRDLFGKGPVSLTSGEVQQEWVSLRLALSTPRAGVTLEVTGALGKGQMQPESYDPVLDQLATGPKTVRQLLANPVIAGFGWARLQEVVKVLVGAGWVQPCLEAGGDAKRAQQTRKFNAAVVRRAVWSGDLQSLASPVTGGGVSVDRFQQLFILAQSEGHADPAAFAWDQIAAQGQSLVKDGKTIEKPEDNLAELRTRYDAFLSGQAPVLKQLGVI